MTRREFEREVAQATGESLATIRSRGFRLLGDPEVEPDLCEDSTPGPTVLDWDIEQAVRLAEACS